ncbi:hypothetical protein PTUN_b0875 [Pseudoalteromonas tunicata]|jgi:hypothetical protein|uniref:Uncharacterized protein n=1 Tax=Pseudoalteromonas tunicata D2 TaxID=87626 RepID=A4C435_9GAMM|nr:hypothetical protein PTUN_b0875 [Pseudoalteromonas tunicata]EAR30317.1 hypothetical protein PTD2_02071 [Pseudoalteromonas tunicata D2]
MCADDMGVVGEKRSEVIMQNTAHNKRSTDKKPEEAQTPTTANHPQYKKPKQGPK